MRGTASEGAASLEIHFTGSQVPGKTGRKQSKEVVSNPAADGYITFTILCLDASTSGIHGCTAEL
jgi:hypothetical protein